MKAFLTLCDKHGKLDGSVKHHLFRTIEQVSLEEADLVFIVITHFEDYEPDFELFERITASCKRIVVVDYIEYGWDKTDTDHIFGINTEEYIKYFSCKEYIHLDAFLKANIDKILIYFKRELPLNSKVSAAFKILPIDYTGILKTLPKSIPPIPFEEYDKPDSFEEFNSRPIDILMIYGKSNPSREQLHGEIMKQAHNNGWNIINNAHTLNNPEMTENGVLRKTYRSTGEPIKKLVVLLYQQHFERMPMAACLKLQQMAKITVSLNGCGRKCFRHAEASYNSVMALQENGLQWAYPWTTDNSIILTNCTNSTLIDTVFSVDTLRHEMDEKLILYNIYLNGIANWEKYETKYYTENHFLKNIREALNGI